MGMLFKSKRTATITAILLAVFTAVSGTMAWQSISQSVINEARSTLNAGGRLHDDYNGETKAIYVENFTNPASGGQNIYVRVRLSEYMEIGAGAGVKGLASNGSTPLVANTNINDATTWTVYTPGTGAIDEGNAIFRPYFDLTFGSATDYVYMPTFNKNKDSLQVDVNGTYAGSDANYETPDDAYFDYVKYQLGETKTADATYDNDENDVEDAGVTAAEETHTAGTIHAASSLVYTMEHWKTVLQSAPGNYWVYDTDGWAYWANPLAPGETTGLLLSENKRTSATIEGDWYYAMNVEGQFVSKDDLGQADQSGFYKDGAPTTDALLLLQTIGAISTNAAQQPLALTASSASITPAGTATISLPVGWTNADVDWTLDYKGLGTAVASIQEGAANAMQATLTHNCAANSCNCGNAAVTVTATSVADPTVTDSVEINLAAVAALTVTSASNVNEVAAGGQLQLNLRENVIPTWSLSGQLSTDTSISLDGLLTVGSDETATKLTVTAADSTGTYGDGTIDITVIPSTANNAQTPAAHTIGIAGVDTASDGNYSLIAAQTGGSYTLTSSIGDNVTWAMERTGGDLAAQIVDNTALKIDEGATTGTLTLTAVSNDDPTVSASITVTVGREAATANETPITALTIVHEGQEYVNGDELILDPTSKLVYAFSVKETQNVTWDWASDLPPEEGTTFENGTLTLAAIQGQLDIQITATYSNGENPVTAYVMLRVRPQVG